MAKQPESQSDAVAVIKQGRHDATPALTRARLPNNPLNDTLVKTFPMHGYPATTTRLRRHGGEFVAEGSACLGESKPVGFEESSRGPTETSKPRPSRR
jgi:hypothetical protein